MLIALQTDTKTYFTGETLNKLLDEINMSDIGQNEVRDLIVFDIDPLTDKRIITTTTYQLI